MCSKTKDPEIMGIREHIAQLYQRKILRAIDRQFALFIGKQLGCDDSPMIGWAALVSYELGKGNVCVDLATLDQRALFDLPPAQAGQLASLLEVKNALDILSSSPAVGNGQTPTPLVLQGERLYFHRYWAAEMTVANEIKKRAIDTPVSDNAREILDQLFSTHDDDLDWQKIAAAVAISSGFSVISGGPGTGKTTTVAKMLAALISCDAANNGTPARHLEIKLVAPTGKAANRLTQSINNAVAALPINPDIRAQIPVQASTIHRLLGVIPQRVRFRYHQHNRLHLDVLVVDEASMVDLSLMAKLLDALPCHARVILLGDRQQLASVEAGAVLGDICSGANNTYSPARRAQIEALTGCILSGNGKMSAVSDGVCILQKSYRFDADSGIGQLAFAINSGEPQQLERVLSRDFADCQFHDLNQDVYLLAITKALDAYRPYLTALRAGARGQLVLEHFSRARVLCALTQGPFGVAGLNQAIENILASQQLIAPNNDVFYLGRPIMVTQNDHALGLYNGDIGIVVMHQDEVRVVFEMSDGTFNAFLPSRLPEHQTAYAMTIHKSQGSEFDHTLLVLPPTSSSVMTRELVYTGITRAKHQLDVYATRSSLSRAMRRKTKRFSGLAKALAVM